MMSSMANKRFWKESAAIPLGDGFGIQLDGRDVKTPAKAPLVVPTRVLAEAIAAEWQAQEDQIEPDTMPMTRRANAAIDKVTHQRAEVADMLAAYGESDLLCHRADGPEALVARQKEQWDPLLDWARDAMNAPLIPSVGIMPARQPEPSLARLSDEIHAMPPFLLTGFHDLVALSGSLVIGFAALRGAYDPETLWQIAHLDELWQQEFWGEDDEAVARFTLRHNAFLDAIRFCGLCQ